ncbi:thioredoxin-like protein [Epithele typhae]|uniref:thioredoxin-like protein n=1 Tax=Epithele typhae TaxID=378194 RepID=UPI002007A729|nr:thioredoxin-like protein [Epithele typhae]KAH9930515.1 thioredoxin-like protein [Epithele typhae]
MSSTLLIHHLNDSRSQRILWLVEELGVPYEVKRYERGADRLAPKELKEVNPLGGAPVITDGGRNLPESGAIVEYIISKYGEGRAQPPEAGMLDNLYFTHYSEASLMPMLVQQLIFKMIPAQAPFLIRPLLNAIFNKISAGFIEPRLKLHADMIEKHLEKCGDWIAGGSEPTAADYMMVFCLEAWGNSSPFLLGPKTKAYVNRAHARPAYKRALEKGGEYKYAGDL